MNTVKRTIGSSFRICHPSIIPFMSRNGLTRTLSRIAGYCGQPPHGSCHAIFMFASNPQHAEWIKSDTAQDRLARVLAESVQRFFPDGGKVGFSVGHKCKTSNPNDRGASIFGGGYEADFAEKVLEKSKVLQEGIHEPLQDREIRVTIGDEVVWSQGVEPDARVTWDPVRGVLRVGIFDCPQLISKLRAASAGCCSIRYVH